MIWLWVAGAAPTIYLLVVLQSAKVRAARIRTSVTEYRGSGFTSAGTIGAYFGIWLLHLLECGQRGKTFFAVLGWIDFDVFLHHHVGTAVINSFNTGEPTFHGTIPSVPDCDMLLTTSMARRPLP